MWDFLESIIPAIFVIFLIIFGGGLIAYQVDKTSCEAQWKFSKMESSYGLWTGCLVKLPDGSWVPSKSIRNF